MSPPSIGLIAWTIYIVILAAACKYILGYSHIKFLREISSEFVQLISGKINSKSINALGMLFFFLLAVTYIFSGSFQKILVLAVEDGGSGASPSAEIWPLTGLMLVFSMFCVIMCNRGSK